jgi:hypothetical protein
MDPVSAVATLGIVAAALVALGVIAKFLHGVYKFLRKIEDTNNIIVKFPEWQCQLDKAMQELHPNTGHSLKDQVTDMHRLLREHISDESIHTPR